MMTLNGVAADPHPDTSSRAQQAEAGVLPPRLPPPGAPPETAAAVTGLDTSKPNIARVYDYWLGGKTNFRADREHADMLLKVRPGLRWLARQNRFFLARAATWLVAEEGVRQFLDIGSGLPAAQNTHQIAQAADPACQVVYADNDPVVVGHARALLADGRNVAAVTGDAADPASILADPAVTRLIRASEPCAVILAMVLHFTDASTARRIVAGFTRLIAPGSYLVISVGSGDHRLASQYPAATLYNHSHDDVGSFFDGLEIIDPPGIVDARHWEPGTRAPSPKRSRAHILAAVARTPQLTALSPRSVKAWWRAAPGGEGREPAARSPCSGGLSCGPRRGNCGLPLGGPHPGVAPGLKVMPRPGATFQQSRPELRWKADPRTGESR